MKIKITSLLFIILLLTSSCGVVKPSTDKCCQEKTKVVSGEKDPLMKLLVAGLIIYAINILVTK